MSGFQSSNYFDLQKATNSMHFHQVAGDCAAGSCEVSRSADARAIRGSLRLLAGLAHMHVAISGCCPMVVMDIAIIYLWEGPAALSH